MFPSLKNIERNKGDQTCEGICELNHSCKYIVYSPLLGGKPGKFCPLFFVEIHLGMGSKWEITYTKVSFLHSGLLPAHPRFLFGVWEFPTSGEHCFSQPRLALQPLLQDSVPYFVGCHSCSLSDTSKPLSMHGGAIRPNLLSWFPWYVKLDSCVLWVIWHWGKVNCAERSGFEK